MIGDCHARHHHQEFLKFLRRLDDGTPPEVDMHLILDNYSTHDLSKIETILLESSDPNGPYGAKEGSMAIAQSAAAAYANAICDARGIWIRHFPFTPEKILQAIEEQEKKPI